MNIGGNFKDGLPKAFPRTEMASTLGDVLASPLVEPRPYGRSHFILKFVICRKVLCAARLLNYPQKPLNTFSQHTFDNLDFSLIYKTPSLAKSLLHNELALLFVYALNRELLSNLKS